MATTSPKLFLSWSWSEHSFAMQFCHFSHMAVESIYLWLSLETSFDKYNVEFRQWDILLSIFSLCLSGGLWDFHGKVLRGTVSFCSSGVLT